MAQHHKVPVGDNDIHFTGNRQLKQYLKEHGKLKSRILSAEQSNTSIVYGNVFFLKLYRKVERAVNPDLEITRFLTEESKFKHIPAYVGAIEWVYPKGSIVLGMMQEMVDNNVDGWHFMLDRLNTFNEKMLARVNNHFEMQPLQGGLLTPVTFSSLNNELKELLDVTVAERARMLGVRTGEMHLALANGKEYPDFKPEEFSLHYQRSLYSSFVTLVRRAYQSLARNMKKLPEHVRKDAEEVFAMREQILQRLKLIFRKKLDVLKIRIHGDYHLGQTLITGKDIIILDFEGEPARSYSERRLKRSPLRDVAGMVRSFHYAAYGSLFLNNQFDQDVIQRMIPFVEEWYHYMSGFYMNAYLETIKGTALVPKDGEDLEILMQTYLLEKSIYELNYELNNRPDWVIIPLRGIKAIMDEVHILTAA